MASLIGVNVSGAAAEPQFITQRRSPRRKLSRAIGFLHRGQYHVTRSLEVSESGLLVQTIPDARVGELVVVTFALPGEKLISVSGEIRYVIDLETGGQGFGILFRQLDLAYKRTIRTYVALKSEIEAQAETQKKHKPKTYAYSFDDSGKAKPTTV